MKAVGAALRAFGKQAGFVAKLHLGKPFWSAGTHQGVVCSSSWRQKAKLRDPRPWPKSSETRGKTLDPDRHAFAYNETFIKASPEAVFAALTNLHEWQDYYANAAVDRGHSPATLSKVGDEFAWRTFAFPQRSKVLELGKTCDGYVVGWDARGTGTYGYHRFMIRGEGRGSRVVTEEVQSGILPAIAGFDVGHLLRSGHQRWLLGLKAHLEDTLK